MSAQTGSVRNILQVTLALGLLGGAAAAAYLGVRSDAIVAEVTRGKAVSAVTGSVVVHAEGDIRELKTEVSGRVEWSEVLEPGRHFKEGDELLRLDATDVKRQIEKAKRDHDGAREKARILRERNPLREIAREELETMRRLQSRGERSEDQVKTAERALKKIDTDLEIADLETKSGEVEYQESMVTLQRLLDKMTIKAPLDGVVHQSAVWKDAIVNQGAVLATFYSNLRAVVAKIGEESFGQIKLGLPAKVTLLTYGPEQFDAKVVKILSIAEAETQRYTVFLEVNIAPERLVPFGTGEVRITVGERDNQPLIPRRALTDGSCVFVAKDGVVEKRRVVVGFTALNSVEIREGLAPGELVIVERLEQFRPGQRIRVTKAN